MSLKKIGKIIVDRRLGIVKIFHLDFQAFFLSLNQERLYFQNVINLGLTSRQRKKKKS